MAAIPVSVECMLSKTIIEIIEKSIDDLLVCKIQNQLTVKVWLKRLQSNRLKLIDLLLPCLHFDLDKTRDKSLFLKVHEGYLPDNRKLVGKAHIILVPLIFLVMLSLAHLSRAEAILSLAPLPLTIPQNMDVMALGERLFNDRRLSGQESRSCATCHPLDRGAMDGLTRAGAADGISPLRNTPTLFNVAYNYFYNWDGVETTLEAHMERVLLNPKVMAANWSRLLDKFRADTGYVQAFSDAYSDGITRVNIVDALVRFERSLVTPNSRFDRFLRGEKNTLNAEEQQGYRLFNSLGCVACHQGVNIGGNLFQKFGVFGTQKGSPKESDDGRYNVTKNERDRGVFRVPSLRNVAVTAPYFHDGRANTLEEAVDTMAKDQLGIPLVVKDRSLIIKFLNTLTGEYRGKPLTRDIVETP